MYSALYRGMAVVCGVLATLALAVGLTKTAHAGDLTWAPPGTYLLYEYQGVDNLRIGAIGVSDQGMTYCIEAGKPAEMVYDEERPIEDGDAARRVAWLADHYVDSRESMIHAAIGVLAHRHFDLNPNAWQNHWKVIKATYPELEQRADALWRQAGETMPGDARATYTYIEGMRSGNVTASVTNASGKPVAGVPYVVTLSGPAEFESGGQRIEGVSKGTATNHAWRATGQGDVTASIVYDIPTLQQLVSNQDYVRYGGASQASGDGVRFSVRQDFTPTVATVAADKIVDAGEPVYDDVTSAVADPDMDFWPEGLELQASGWYFDGIAATDLDKALTPNDGESAESFLKRLADKGFSPAAYGTARFDAPGRTVRVQAMTEPDGGTAYAAPKSGGIGTWVWAFERDRQSEQAQRYVLDDSVSAFLDHAETNANRAKVNVESTVTEHSASVGSELSDTITVQGFPDDHGEFQGDDAFGIGADEPLAQVSVWWSGDPDDPDNDDAYRPDTVEVPAEDEHHKLVGTWDYPAVNGTIRVGGGVADAHGDPVTITAERHGWYVFVWSFQGDDRVMPAASAYNDAWERTRVGASDEPDRPGLTTQVKPDRVQVGEPFFDTAHVVGTVPEGAYVEFDAYEAVDEDTEPGGNGKLVDGARVEVDHTLRDQTVSSPDARSPETGLVYWQATLFSPEGDVLATHELGAEGEVVTVEEPPAVEPETLATTGSSLNLVSTIAGVAAISACVALGVLHWRNRSGSGERGREGEDE